MKSSGSGLASIVIGASVAFVTPAYAAPEHANTSSVAPKSVDSNNSKLPVEISADNLEVLQNENRAIFKGNVVAVQGTVRLKADKMIVHYKQDNKSAAKPGEPAPEAKPAAPATPVTGVPSSMGAVTLIEVEGNVFIATPQEAASGEKGNYEVDKKLLHLTGDNVVLTRGKNILRGTALEYNMETGHSVLTNEGGKPGGVNGGRVRGVFVPNSEQNPPASEKGETTPKAVPAEK